MNMYLAAVTLIITVIYITQVKSNITFSYSLISEYIKIILLLLSSIKIAILSIKTKNWNCIAK